MLIKYDIRSNLRREGKQRENNESSKSEGGEGGLTDAVLKKHAPYKPLWHPVAWVSCDPEQTDLRSSDWLGLGWVSTFKQKALCLSYYFYLAVPTYVLAFGRNQSSSMLARMGLWVGSNSDVGYVTRLKYKLNGSCLPLNSSLKWPWWMLLCTEAIMKNSKSHAIKRNSPHERVPSRGSSRSGVRERVLESRAPHVTSRSLDAKYLRASIIYTLLQ